VLIIDRSSRPAPGAYRRSPKGLPPQDPSDELVQEVPVPQPRIGVVGSGFIAREHVRAWSQLGAEVAIYSDHTGSRDELCRRFGAAARATLGDLLAAAAIVDVCTPTDTHHGIVLSAAQAGRHVICEKPLSRRARQARQMADACAAADVRLFPAHVVRFFPEYAAAKAAVVDGRIGTPAILRFSRRASLPTWSPWYLDEQRSGGLLMDFMIHDYDMARWLGGEVERVFAMLPTPEGQSAGKDKTGATGLVVLTHAGGAISHIHGAWVATSLVFLDTEFELSGDRGVLFSPSSAADPMRHAGTVAPPGGGHFAAGGTSPFAGELAEFLAAIETGGRPRVGPADGVAAVAIAEAAIESARSGAAVCLTAGAS
jgi:myo-inositol 2-dehydrogenase / D-chiro-inositol 1-dehydrogenase